MSHKNGLVILRSPGKKRGNERNPETSTLVSKQVREARGLVVLVFRQVGISELAHGHK